MLRHKSERKETESAALLNGCARDLFSDVSQSRKNIWYADTVVRRRGLRLFTGCSRRWLGWAGDTRPLIGLGSWPSQLKRSIRAPEHWMACSPVSAQLLQSHGEGWVSWSKSKPHVRRGVA